MNFPPLLQIHVLFTFPHKGCIRFPKKVPGFLKNNGIFRDFYGYFLEAKGCSPDLYAIFRGLNPCSDAVHNPRKETRGCQLPQLPRSIFLLHSKVRNYETASYWKYRERGTRETGNWREILFDGTDAVNFTAEW